MTCRAAIRRTPLAQEPDTQSVPPLARMPEGEAPKGDTLSVRSDTNHEVRENRRCQSQ